jgi:hypothetical protein
MANVIIQISAFANFLLFTFIRMNKRCKNINTAIIPIISIMSSRCETVKKSFFVKTNNRKKRATQIKLITM